MSSPDAWWPKAAPTKADRIAAVIWLVVAVPLFLNAFEGWRLLNGYDRQAAAVLALVGYFVIVRPHLSKLPSRGQQASYAARTIREFLAGSGRNHDWDDFTSCSLSDPEVDRIRRHARDIDLPLDEDGVAALTCLANEADALTASDGS